MKLLKVSLLTLFVAGTVVGCATHTHERVIEKQPASSTTVVK